MKRGKKILATIVAAVMLLGIGVASAIAAETPETLPLSEKTDRFSIMDDFEGNSMISSDGELVIHISDGTPIIFEDDVDVRESLEEEQTLMDVLDGRKLVVSYSITTRSIPPQTTPEKIVVLYEGIMTLPESIELEHGLDLGIEPPIHNFTQEELNQMVANLNGEIVVNGEIIDAPAPYLIDNDDALVVMVPLRAIAEKLGFDVNWDAEVKGIRIGAATNLWIDKDEYVVGRMAPISLGVAPELIDGVTYVPMSFFRDVIPEFDVFSFEGQVVINSLDKFEAME